MNPYDPYAAPRAAPPPPTPYAPDAAQGPWTIGDTLGAAWRAYASRWLPLTIAPILVGLVFVVPMFVLIGAWVGPELGSPQGLALALQDPTLNASILGWNTVQIFVWAFFGVGLVRMRVAAARGQEVRFGELFSGGSRYLPMLGLQLVTAAPGLAINGLGIAARYAGADMLFTMTNLLGNLWFLVLMLLQGFGLAFAEYFVVDRSEGTIAAIKSAFGAPSGDRGRVFGYLLVTALIAIAGAFCCGLPALVTMPYASVCVAALYLRLAPPDAAQAFAPPPPAAPPY